MLSIFRSIAKAILQEGFILDEDPLNFENEDFIHAQMEQAVNSLVDFILSLSILRLLYFKNKDHIKA